ncbi:MAG: bacteriocin family protein [Anaerolineae bacterium]|nr:bacteriocin family protein [Anaerolineae bacterium]
MELLLRQDAPLSDQEWEQIDSAVMQAARANLVGRRFISLYGPLGLGVQAVWVDKVKGVSPGTMGTYGEEETDEVVPTERRLLALEMLYKDFRLTWRDIATARDLHAPLDVSAGAAAGAMLARAEDRLVFYGTDDNPGIMRVPGHVTVAIEAGWEEPGSGLAAVAQARSLLVANAAMGPYALVLAPDLYTKLLRILGHGGRLELELIKSVAEAGVFQSPILDAGTGALVSSGPDVLDLAIGGDIQVAYKGPEELNHPFRVLETLALRIRRPEGICVLE